MAGKESLLDKLERFLRQEVSEGHSSKAEPGGPSCSEPQEAATESGSELESSQDCAAVGDSSSPVAYSASDYLAKGKTSTQAAKAFHHILKVAACEAKIWGSGLSLKQVPPARRKYIHDRVIGECPALKGHSRDIDLALARGLANSNYYQREKKKKGKGKQKAESASSAGVQNKSKKNKGKDKMSHEDEGGRGSTCSTNEQLVKGDKVIIFNKDKDLAEGLFVKELSPGMYSEVKFLKTLDASDIDLPEKAGDKTHLGQLKRNDVFKWKSTKIKKKNESRRERKRNTMFDSDYYS